MCFHVHPLFNTPTGRVRQQSAFERSLCRPCDFEPSPLLMFWLYSLPATSGPAPETPELPAIAAAIAETAPLPSSELAPAAAPEIEVEPPSGTSSPAGTAVHGCHRLRLLATSARRMTRRQ